MTAMGREAWTTREAVGARLGAPDRAAGDRKQPGAAAVEKRRGWVRAAVDLRGG